MNQKKWIEWISANDIIIFIRVTIKTWKNDLKQKYGNLRHSTDFSNLSEKQDIILRSMIINPIVKIFIS